MSDPKVTPTRLVRCPRCKKSVRYDPANAFRPFCSAVCKDEDIIAWAQGDFRVPGEMIDPDQGPFEDEES